MRGGALPPALIAAALGFALAFVPRRAWAVAVPTFVVTAAVISLAPLPDAWSDALFLGCWATIVGCALSMHLKTSLGIRGAVLLSLNSGLWAGAVIAVAGQPLDLLKAAPWVLICGPAAWVVSRRWQVAVKVAASWLVAVSILAASLPATTRTPGYAADHME